MTSRNGTALVVGGTSGIGRALAERLVSEGMSVVITGRDAGRAQQVAAEIGTGVRGLALELTDASSVRGALADVEEVHALVITAIDRDFNSVKDYDVTSATRLALMKLVGYTEVAHVLADRLAADASIVLFGGVAAFRPYPGSTTVTSVNGAVTAMVRTMASELAPVRVNALHPGIVGDSPAWADKDVSYAVSRTPIGRTVTMAEVVDATLFLLDNGGINGHNLVVDGGSLVG